MANEGTFKISLNLNNSRTDVDLTIPSEKLKIEAIKEFTSGYLWHDEFELQQNESVLLNFSDGSLLDVYGTEMILSGITGIYVAADSTNVGLMVISGIAGSMLPTLPGLAANEGFGIESYIDVTSLSALCLVSTQASGIVDIAVMGG